MVKIKALPNGPYVIESGGAYVIIKEGKEETIEQKAIALCRCGASSNKPFCDGSHKKIEFQAGEDELRINP